MHARDQHSNISNVPLKTHDDLYFVQLEVGSKGEKVSAYINLNSGVVALPASEVVCYDIPKADESEYFKTSSYKRVRRDDASIKPTTNTCTSYGSFETGKSDSWTKFDETYHIFNGVLDVRGTYGADSVQMNGEKIDNAPFIVFNETYSIGGSLGLASNMNNTYATSSSEIEYDTFLDRLVKEGIIERNIFSLYLNNPNALSGFVLFGGVDYAKIDGKLTTIPMIKDFANGDYQILMSGLDLVVNGESHNMYMDPDAVKLTSLQYTILPIEVFDNIVTSLNATQNHLHTYYINCPADDSIKLSFHFPGIDIEVPLNDLVLPNPKGDLCLLKIRKGLQPYLGNDFLKHAYVVFDNDKSEISLGKVKYTDKTNISVISSSLLSASRVTTTSMRPSESFVTLTTPISYSTGIKSFNQVDLNFLSEAFSYIVDENGNVVSSGAEATSKSKSSKGGSSSSMVKLSCFFTSIWFTCFVMNVMNFGSLVIL